MGEVADLVIDGILCQLCGTLVDGSATGYPRSCEDCEEPEEEDEV